MYNCYYTKLPTRYIVPGTYLGGLRAVAPDADHPTLTRTRTLWGDLCLDVAACEGYTAGDNFFAVRRWRVCMAYIPARVEIVFFPGCRRVERTVQYEEHTNTHISMHLPPPDYWHTSSFWQVQVPTRNCSFSVFAYVRTRSPLGRI